MGKNTFVTSRGLFVRGALALSGTQVWVPLAPPARSLGRTAGTSDPAVLGRRRERASSRPFHSDAGEASHPVPKGCRGALSSAPRGEASPPHALTPAWEAGAGAGGQRQLSRPRGSQPGPPFLLELPCTPTRRGPSG